MFFDDPAGRLTTAGMEHMRQDFYTAMGWNSDGRVKAVGLADFLKPEIQKGA
jgi:hypothetical protein